MRIVAVSNDLATGRASWARCCATAGIACVLLDSHVSAVEGGIGAFPRRLAVAEDDATRAGRVLAEAGEA